MVLSGWKRHRNQHKQHSNSLSLGACRGRRSLPQRTGSYGVNNGTPNGDPGFIVSSLPIAAYYGTGDSQCFKFVLGKQPQAGSVYTGPVATPACLPNPISQIIDANGNLLVITTFGTEVVLRLWLLSTLCPERRFQERSPRLDSSSFQTEWAWYFERPVTKQSCLCSLQSTASLHHQSF